MVSDRAVAASLVAVVAHLYEEIDASFHAKKSQGDRKAMRSQLVKPKGTVNRATEADYRHEDWLEVGDVGTSVVVQRIFPVIQYVAEGIHLSACESCGEQLTVNFDENACRSLQTCSNKASHWCECTYALSSSACWEIVSGSNCTGSRAC